ncbi:hypothetical protein GJ654_00770 [Rhodoblastus acidophilus]|uniref:Uncharacterized protein n=1 Tax=Rhodoblastus acidophilus TaxID=1074 RepID=A0A6N8DHD6_RHOAC|nr:hypothetical protein [Rhodoblastus acidophilus]MCW2272605.1 hypothetical protein [Rhodoblastus acidophilus]MTV29518.1 hypothetical protein [Rhodoblastus acidophilus]
MLLTIFGTPSPLTYWLIHVARSAANVIFGGHHYISAVSLEDMRAAWSERDGRAVVFHADIPQGKIVELFLQSNFPYLVSSDAALDIVGYATLTRDLGFRDALRFASQSLSILAQLRHTPHALYLDELCYDVYATDAIQAIVHHFNVTANASHMERIHRTVLRGADYASTKVLDLVLQEFPKARYPGSYANLYSATELSIINDTIRSYGALMASRQIQKINWRPELVLDRDNPDLMLDGPREMTGPARLMFGGHLLHLPAGAWKAAVTLEIAENHSGNRLLSQVYVGADLLQQVTATLPESGVFQYEMDFVVQDSFFPVQVYVGIAEGAIEGRLLLISLTLDRLEAA